MQRSEVQVGLSVPFVGEVRGTWKPDVVERKAAWELYVELVTRVGIVQLASEDGNLRESLSSLHSIFSTARTLLREYGPDIAIPRNTSRWWDRVLRRATDEGTISLATIILAVINGGIRPVLARWHPVLADHEGSRPDGVSPTEHERAWAHSTELRSDLNELRELLLSAARLLAEACGAESLMTYVATGEWHSALAGSMPANSRSISGPDQR